MSLVSVNSQFFLFFFGHDIFERDSLALSTTPYLPSRTRYTIRHSHKLSLLPSPLFFSFFSIFVTVQELLSWFLRGTANALSLV